MAVCLRAIKSERVEREGGLVDGRGKGRVARGGLVDDDEGEKEARRLPPPQHSPLTCHLDRRVDVARQAQADAYDGGHCGRRVWVGRKNGVWPGKKSV